MSSNANFMTVSNDAAHDSSVLPLQLLAGDEPNNDQKFILEPHKPYGHFALKTRKGFYLTISPNATRPGSAGNLAEPVYFQSNDQLGTISIIFIRENLVCLKSPNGLFVTATDGGGLTAPPNSNNWNYNTQVTKNVGPNELFQFSIKPHIKRKRSVEWDPNEVKAAGNLLKPLFSTSLVESIWKAAEKKTYFSSDNAQLISQLMDSFEIKELVKNTASVYPRPKPHDGARERGFTYSGPPKSISLNFGGSIGFFVGGSFCQSITFDLNENRPGSGVALYAGSSSVGGTLGLKFGGSSGGSVSLNWFEAKDAGGWFWGVSLSVVIGGGVNFAGTSTLVGPSLTFGLAGGLDIGVSAAGGYAFYEGGAYYNLPGGPQHAPPVKHARAVRLLDLGNLIFFSGNQNELIFQCGLPIYRGKWGTFQVYETQETGTVPVYEYILNVRDKDGKTLPIYYYSTGSKPPSFIAPAKPKFYAYPTPVPGKTVPIHLYTKRVENGPQLYWYTPVSPPNIDGAMPTGYTHSTIAFHAMI